MAFFLILIEILNTIRLLRTESGCHSERSEESLQSFAACGTQETTAEMLRRAQADNGSGEIVHVR